MWPEDAAEPTTLGPRLCPNCRTGDHAWFVVTTEPFTVGESRYPVWLWRWKCECHACLDPCGRTQTRIADVPPSPSTSESEALTVITLAEQALEPLPKRVPKTNLYPPLPTGPPTDTAFSTDTDTLRRVLNAMKETRKP